MNTDVHRHTPTLAAIDNRGLTTRLVAYHRRQARDTVQARITRQAHNPSGQMISAGDARLSGESSTANQSYAYSLSGLVLSSRNVDAGQRLRRYTDGGNVTETWDTRGGHWQTDYDEQLRPTAIYEQDNGQPKRASQRFTYAPGCPEAALRNQCGRLIRHDDAAGSLLRVDYGLTGSSLKDTRHFLNTLDAPDWPSAVTEREQMLEAGGGASTVWTYSPLAQMLEQLDAAGHRQTLNYTLTGQLAATTLRSRDGDEQRVVHAMSYNAFGLLECQTTGNGVVSRDTYDAADGRLLNRTAVTADRKALQDLSYGYDPVGNIVRVEDHTQSTRYFNNQRVDGVNTSVYDSLDQLIEATGREVAGARIQPGLPDLAGQPGDTSQLLNYTQHYHYDAGGNLTQLRHVGHQNYTREMRVAAGSNRSLPVTQGQSAIEFADSFDANGNLLVLETGQLLQWNSLNQLHSVMTVARPLGVDDSERYIYDGGGQRVRKVSTRQTKTTTQTSEVRYLPGLELRTEHSQKLEVMTQQAGHCNVRYLHWTEGKPSLINNNQLRYGLSDHLKSTGLEVDENGHLLSHEGYYPYGGTAWWAARSEVHAHYKTVRYSGKERDASGMYYYGFRYYAPWLQRWINPDPAGDADGLNLYKMVNNSPVSSMDPDGLMFKHVARGTAGIAYVGYQLAKPSDRQRSKPPPIAEKAGIQSPGVKQADQWLEKSKQTTMDPMNKVSGSLTGRLTAAFHLAQGQVPGAKAVVKGAGLAAEAVQFAAQSDVSEVNKASLVKSAVVDAYTNMGNVITATAKAAHTATVAATLPQHKQDEVRDELVRRSKDAKDGLTTSIATGVAVAGVLDTAATLAPPGPIKLGLIGVSIAWKATGFVHTTEELSKFAAQHKDLISNEFGKDLAAQVKSINQQKRSDLIDKYTQRAP